MTHEERDAVIREYRAGTTKILIATDVLARGFDQAQVSEGESREGSEEEGRGGGGWKLGVFKTLSCLSEEGTA